MIRNSKLRLNKLMMLLSKVPPPKLLIVMNNNSSRKRLPRRQHRSKIKNPLKLTSKILRPRRQNRLAKPPYLMQMLTRIKMVEPILLQEVTRHQLIKLSSRQRLMS